MLVEIAIGDAYGAGFEYAPASWIQQWNTGSSYVDHPWHRQGPGRYTDDTQMSIAITEAIVSGEPWTPDMLAARFVDAFRRDPRTGYSKERYQLLQEVQDGQEYLQRVRTDTDTSGAAMRAGPIGVFPTVAAVREHAALQAAVTHDTPGGIQAAVAAALAAHYFLYRLGPKRQLGQFLAEIVPGPWEQPWSGRVGAQGLMSVHAAVAALMGSARMSDLLRTCVAFSGDTDTVAAIALGAGSCAEEIEQDLSADLYRQLEDGPYGRRFLEQLDERLMALVT
jgi:ADP-ribosylglycohydrolase